MFFFEQNKKKDQNIEEVIKNQLNCNVSVFDFLEIEDNDIE